MIDRKRVAIAAAVDIVVIVAFVAIGRKNHDESGSAVTGALEVAAPFLIALAMGWIIARAWKAPMAPVTGIIVWLVTLVVGMVLRRFAFSDGTALPFIIVATLFTGLFLVGWRVVAQWGEGRSALP